MHSRRLALLLLAAASAAVALYSLSAEEPEEGRRYALIVGVQDYKGTDLGSLHYCDNDAAGLAEVLGQRGYRVTLMTQPAWKASDRDDLLPTADNIRDNLKAILRNRKPADTVLLAFSGHGEQLKKDGKMYFCAAKCNLDKPETLVALDEVYDLLKDNPAGGKVLIVDACRNDPLAGRTVGSEKLESVTRPELPDPPGGTVALFSCSKGEKAYESDALKHGYLFHFVIEGLAGKAAGKGGRIKWTDLTKHVDDELSEAVVKELGAKAVQTPEVRGESHGLVLARIDTVSAPPDGPTTGGKVAGPSPTPPDAPTTEVKAVDEKEETFEYTVEGETKKGTRRVWTLDLGGGATMELVRIPHGQFMMGSPDSDKYAQAVEKPRHEVTITKDFYLGKYLVTQEQYQALMGMNPSYFSASGPGRASLASLDTGRFPVEEVTWEAAQAFCQKLSRKAQRKAGLPTEAQWEYACRAGTTTRFPCGDELTSADANFNSKPGLPCVVGSHPANPFGLYDATGNVWEWCSDYYDPKYYSHSPKEDPENLTESSARVLRGGSFTDAPTLCRAGCRYWYHQALRFSYVGFRVRVGLE